MRFFTCCGRKEETYPFPGMPSLSLIIKEIKGQFKIKLQSPNTKVTSTILLNSNDKDELLGLMGVKENHTTQDTHEMAPKFSLIPLKVLLTQKNLKEIYAAIELYYKANLIDPRSRNSIIFVDPTPPRLHHIRAASEPISNDHETAHSVFGSAPVRTANTI